MLYCKEIIKQNSEYQFKKTDNTMYTDLNNVVNCLFPQYQSGVRAIVVCTERSNEVLDEEEFRSQLSGGRKKVVILSRGKQIPPKAVGCARLEPSKCLGQALMEMIERIGQAVGDAYINRDAKTAASIYCGYNDLIKKVDPRIEWNMEIADRASQVLHTEEMKNDIGRVPNICILLILPESFFEIFSSTECYFPLFIEYVVHAVDVSQALQDYSALQTQVQEKNKQLEKKDKIIQEQSHLLDRIKNEPAELQSKVGETNTSELSVQTRSVIEEYPEVKTQHEPETGQTAIPIQATQTNLAIDTAEINELGNHESEVH